MKQREYHFSIPFTYIEKNLGNNNYVDGQATMEVDAIWDECDEGYRLYYHCPQENIIDPNEGNGSIEETFEEIIYFEVMDELESLGIDAGQVCITHYKR